MRTPHRAPTTTHTRAQHNLLDGRVRLRERERTCRGRHASLAPIVTTRSANARGGSASCAPRAMRRDRSGGASGTAAALAGGASRVGGSAAQRDSPAAAWGAGRGRADDAKRRTQRRIIKQRSVRAKLITAKGNGSQGSLTTPRLFPLSRSLSCRACAGSARFTQRRIQAERGAALGAGVGAGPPTAARRRPRRLAFFLARRRWRRCRRWAFFAARRARRLPFAARRFSLRARRRASRLPFCARRLAAFLPARRRHFRAAPRRRSARRRAARRRPLRAVRLAAARRRRRRGSLRPM